MPGKVLIGSRSFGKFTDKGLKLLTDNDFQIINNPFGRAILEDELCEILKEVHGIITGMDQLTEKVITNSRDLKVISKHGVGVDNINVASATLQKIFVTNVPTVPEEANAVADFTFALMMSIARNICNLNESTKKGEWVKFIGAEVYGKTLGIIGGGIIGKALIKRAKCFDMKILVHDIRVDKEIEEKYLGRYVDLEYLLRNSDFISIHLPLNDSTKNLIDKKELAIIKTGSFLINAARGGIVNEDALYNTLKDKKIRGAALDVFEDEPCRFKELLSLDNLIVTPHCAAYTQSCMEALDLISAQNVLDVLKGSKPKVDYTINKELL